MLNKNKNGLMKIFTSSGILNNRITVIWESIQQNHYCTKELLLFAIWVNLWDNILGESIHSLVRRSEAKIIWNTKCLTKCKKHILLNNFLIGHFVLFNPNTFNIYDIVYFCIFIMFCFYTIYWFKDKNIQLFFVVLCFKQM